MRKHSVGAVLAMSLAVLAATSVASARQIAVRPGGGSASIAAAIRSARAGDVVTIAAGTYTGSIWVDTGGERGRPITVRAADGLGSVVIEGGGETLNIGNGAHDLVFQGLELRNSGDNIVHIQAAHDIVLRDLLVHDAGDEGDAIKVNQARDILIERVECYHPGRRPSRPSGNPAQECIDFVDVTRAIVQDSYLHDGGNMLMYAKGASRDIVFQRNIIVGQGPDSIDPCVGLGAWTDRSLLRGSEYEAEDIVMRNNIVARCRTGAVGVYDARRVWLVNNTLVDCGPDVIQFRAGNAPREESRDVHIVNNIIADTSGAMVHPVVLLSHRIEGLDAHHNLYWNAGRAIGASLVDPAREAGAMRVNPGFSPVARRDTPRAQLASGFLPRARSAVIDCGVQLRGPGEVTDDFSSRPRPAGAGIDIGALEAEAAPRTAVVPRAFQWPSELAAR